MQVTRSVCARIVLPRYVHGFPCRTLFGLSFKHQASKPAFDRELVPQDQLFHPLSQSPVSALRKRGEVVRSMAPCPVCLDVHDERRPVQFECPDCGWPTHSTEEHWKADKEHSKYCSRLREANEDEHYLRSGRELQEFVLPGRCTLSDGANTHTISRPTGPGGSGFIRELGYILVYQDPPINQFGAVEETSFEVTHLSSHNILCVARI